MMQFAGRLFSSYWLYAILAIVLVGLVSLIKTTQTYRIESGESLAKDMPRIVMHRVNVTHFNSQGRVELNLTADGLAQFVDQRTSASNPLIVLFGDAGPRAFLRSRRVDVLDQNMHLSGEVSLATPAQPQLLSSKTMDYNHTSKMLEAASPVLRLSTDSYTSLTTSERLEANLTSRKMNMIGQVHTSVVSGK